jgi:hypothetical protein
MALRLSNDLKNEVINHIISQVAGTCWTAGTASIKIYTGSQPADADTAPAGTSGTLLCTIIAMGWAAGTCGATAGTAALACGTGYFGTAVATGTAGWARIQTVGADKYTGSAGTYNIDGDVGTSAAYTFVINSVSVTNLSRVTLLTAPISIS